MFNPLADIITPRLELRLIPEEVMAAYLSHQLGMSFYVLYHFKFLNKEFLNTKEIW